MSLEGEGIVSLGDSFRGVGKLVYLSLARNSLSSLMVIFAGATKPVEARLIGDFLKNETRLLYLPLLVIDCADNYGNVLMAYCCWR